METLQAISTKAHLKLLKSRIISYKRELELAQIESEELRKTYESTWKKGQEMREECLIKRRELEADHNDQMEEYKRQINIGQEMLHKEKEKRNSLLIYLNGLNMPIKMPSDLRDFDWTKLNDMVSTSSAELEILKRKEKVPIMSHLNKLVIDRLNEMFTLLNSTIMIRNKVQNKLVELSSMSMDWNNVLNNQERRIKKVRDDNNRLDILIKQCLNVNEPLSKHVTDNVRAKCHSFLNSNTVDELISGLKKYKIRQERMIKLLRHKEKKLSRDINLLQVATDRTTDQMQYYNTIIKSHEISI